MRFLCLLAFMVIVFTSCDLLKSIEPKTEVDKFLEKVEAKTWVVDSIWSRKYSVERVLVQETMQATGTIDIQKINEDANHAELSYLQGYFLHHYTQDNVAKTDSLAWSYDVDLDVKVKYFKLFFKNPSQPGFPGKVIYDLSECTEHKLRLYRYEALQDNVTGNYYGFLETVYVMHR